MTWHNAFCHAAADDGNTAAAADDGNTAAAADDGNTAAASGSMMRRFFVSDTSKDIFFFFPGTEKDFVREKCQRLVF
jgi:hypothetical protein